MDCVNGQFFRKEPCNAGKWKGFCGMGIGGKYDNNKLMYDSEKRREKFKKMFILHCGFNG